MEKQPLHGNTSGGYAREPFFLANITIICRLWGLATIAVLWAGAVTTIQSGHDQYYVGWYLVGAGVLVTWYEITWFFDKSACCLREGCCCKCWSIMMWVDNWKKGILYLALSIPTFISGMRIILGMVSGFLLIILGCLYIVKTFKYGIVYTKHETRYVSTATPTVSMVTHEISTQTDDDMYYSLLAEYQRRQQEQENLQQLRQMP
ncbi:uncharacterized protein [Haliotis cracherodii]|uniref:uncharacterized protein LOC124132450 n=1 Tax=Haliotis rufescens TaxID=6454 RepID=UPI001EAFB9AA|nr:uncharacterized protein LOC124132450 [Haliotis rufescens]